MHEITGILSYDSKRIVFDKKAPLVVGENRTALISVEIPNEIAQFDIYLLFQDVKGIAGSTPKLMVDENSTVHYTLLNGTIKSSGTFLLQLIAVDKSESGDAVFKSLINNQLYINTALCGDEIYEEAATLLADIQNTIDSANLAAENANAVAMQILIDKSNGVFDGQQGEKGDPSSLDKLGINATIINLSDRDVSTFGTQDAPILISEESTITFVGYTPIPGYKKSFELCIKRTADVAVIWAQITEPNWAYREIPLLPVDRAQKILVETVDGVNYYGTGGDVF